jgi:putative ABC transport system permease protein
MIRNYIVIAWRNLNKNKFSTVINILGLSVGLTCCLLIGLYLQYETGYDKFHRNGDQIFQVATNLQVGGTPKENWATTPTPMAASLKQEYPEILESARLLNLLGDDKLLFQHFPENGQPKAFYEDKGMMADPSFFKIFDYEFVEGSAKAALMGPNTVVISQTIAKKIFGNAPALNRIVRVSSNFNGEQDLRVTGVYKPFSQPTHLDVNFFISLKGGDMERYLKNHLQDFVTNNMFYTYIELAPNTDYKLLEAKFPAFLKKYAGDKLKASGFVKEQFLIPVRDIHLFSNIKLQLSSPVSPTYLFILGSIALFTLVIACINFMNLATARSAKRSAEVGVRKVLGAERKNLIFQFLSESFLMILGAYPLSILLTVLLLPLFNTISGKDISLSFALDIRLIVFSILLAFVTAVLAGSYPAFYLSSFNPITVLKGKLANSLSVMLLRKGLVIFQFTISIVLIIAAIIIAKQMYFLQHTDLGFKKDQQLVIPLRSQQAKKNFAALKNNLRSDSRLHSVSASNYYPGIFNPSSAGLYREGQVNEENKNVNTNLVDIDFLKTLSIEKVAGRLFSTEFAADTFSRMIINEQAVRELGFVSPEEAVGEKLHLNNIQGDATYEVIGVVKDFHFQDLHHPLMPYGFFLAPTNWDAYNYMIVNIKEGNFDDLLENIRGSWNRLNPNEPFEYYFMDDQFQNNYKAEQRLSGVVVDFTVLAIFISCLGLIGLAAFSAEQRVKEIGVRKVLGAGVSTIIMMLSKDFLKLILIAVLIAIPISWYIMNQWLQGFAYREPINWIVFAIAGAGAFIIAIVAIGYQAIKAATANPIESLRNE